MIIYAFVCIIYLGPIPCMYKKYFCNVSNEEKCRLLKLFFLGRSKFNQITSMDYPVLKIKRNIDQTCKTKRLSCKSQLNQL